MSVSGITGRGAWFKSSFSKDSNSCVEVRFANDVVEVRDSKYQGAPADQPVIAIPIGNWADFLSTAARGVGSSAQPGAPVVVRHHDGTTTLRGSQRQELVFTASEWTAFTRGVQAGEFFPAAA